MEVIILGERLDFHVRISPEERDFLEEMGINKSKLVHDGIKGLMDELPKSLNKRKKEIDKEKKEIDRKLALLKTKKAVDNCYLEDIVNDFIRYGRENQTYDQNITWLSKYKDGLERKNITISLPSLLEYCNKKVSEVRK